VCHLTAKSCEMTPHKSPGLSSRGNAHCILSSSPWFCVDGQLHAICGKALFGPTFRSLLYTGTPAGNWHKELLSSYANREGTDINQMQQKWTDSQAYLGNDAFQQVSILMGKFASLYWSLGLNCESKLSCILKRKEKKQPGDIMWRINFDKKLLCC